MMVSVFWRVSAIRPLCSALHPASRLFREKSVRFAEFDMEVLLIVIIIIIMYC
jgi:hypothetical protein